MAVDPHSNRPAEVTGCFSVMNAVARFPPGDAARREVVLSTSSSSSPQGGATHVQKGMVSLCPRYLPIVDERSS